MKVYNKIALDIQSIALENSILGASNITKGNAQPTGEESGDGLARQNGGESVTGMDFDWDVDL